ncbi:hypothetical protein [Providencia sp. Je.9.19]|uniref:hypothetical protein n=1 Tax=Providencia sp. Je.9.19 TaxID=3142844 RepID=UPI003DA9FFF1
MKEMGFEVGSHCPLTRQAGQLIIWLAERGVRQLKRSLCGAGIFYLKKVTLNYWFKRNSHFKCYLIVLLTKKFCSSWF